MIHFFSSLPKLWASAVRDLNSHFSMTFSSIFSISISLFMASLMIIAAMSLDDISNNIEDEFIVQVSLSPDLDNEETEQLYNEISALPEVSSVEYSTKEEELDTLIENNGEMFSQYKGSRNPLYNVFLLTIKDTNYVNTLKDSLNEMDGVIAIDYGGDLILALMHIFDTLKTVGGALVILFGFVAIFLIRGSIRMSLATRADEISIMRQVGASNWYIMTPYIIEGLLIGLFGSLIPGIILLVGYPVLYSVLSVQLTASVFTIPAPSPFMYYLFWGMILVGCLIGTSGSYLAARKHLRLVR